MSCSTVPPLTPIPATTRRPDHSGSPPPKQMKRPCPAAYIPCSGPPGAVSSGQFVGGDAVRDGRVRLVGREHRPGDLRAVHAEEGDQVPAGVDDGGRYQRALRRRFVHSRLTHPFGQVKVDLHGVSVGDVIGNEDGPIGRIRLMNAQAVNLDGFAREDPALGLVALRAPDDPEPSLVIKDGVVTELDSRPMADFDAIDAFIAAHGIDAAVAAEADDLDDIAFARLFVDPGTPREDVVRLARGATPAKLARVVALLRPVELQMRSPRCKRAPHGPSSQAHVTNRLDDPLLLAADAATAAAYGFRELETTVPVLADAPSNAVAVTIGSVVGSAGVLVQCSVEEAMELELALHGLTSYAETVSLYGTESVFVDGDDTPWSKAFLTSAYASRGVKMRVTSGGGAEALMGDAEGKSMLYLESRCVSLARAMGVQGVQNGGIDGASVVGSVPGGMRELLAENLLVMLRDLESCSGNDALVSESDVRRTAHTVPLFLAGSDFLFSGFGSIQRYDNMFGPSNFNGEDIDDFLVLQRDWGVDGALRPVTEERLRAVRRARRGLRRRSTASSGSGWRLRRRARRGSRRRRGLQRHHAAGPSGGARGGRRRIGPED